MAALVWINLLGVTFLYMLDNVPQRYAGVGHPTKGVDLPQQHTKAPHVRLVGKLRMSQGLDKKILISFKFIPVYRYRYRRYLLFVNKN